MSSDQLPPEPSAVALVVDSSLAIGNEWPQVFGEYISVLLKRLGEAVPNPSTRVRLAYVSYATADTVPSPILCKRFFVEPNILFRDMNNDLPKYGIGQTSSGGSRGMAALEGLVAAVELFDILQPPSRDPQSSKPINCHILHIAAASPDTTQQPFWNQSPALDEVTWDLLPVELKKRNIHFSTINLLPSLKRFPELYKAVVSNGTAPWFPIRSPHSFLLDSFTPPSSQHPQAQQIKGTAVKRSNPSQADRPTELKKARPSAATDSPKIPPTQSNPVVSQTIHPATAPPQPSRPPQNAVANPQLPPNPALRQHQAAQIAERIRNAEEHLKQLQQNIAAAEAAGNLQLVETLRQEYAKKQEQNMNFKKALTQYIQNQNQQLLARQQAQAHLAASQNQQALQKEAMAPSVGQGVNPNAVPSPASLPGMMQDVTQVPNRQPHVRSASSSAFQLNSPAQITASISTPPNPGAAPNVQNLLEQQRLRASQMGGSQSQGGVPMQNVTPHGNQSFNPSPGMSQTPQGEQQKPPPNNATPVWAGSLNWSGTGSAGKKEVCTYVIASSTNVASCHVTTWPRSLTLVPTRESLVPNPDLLIWIKRHNPAVCTLAPNPRVQDTKTNEFNFFTLVQLLTTKKIYATAGWTTPSGSQDNNVLLFPVSGRGLAGAFFPLTGVPEMPKAGAVPFNLSPEATARFQAFTPEQRNVFLTHMARQRQQQQMAQQQQQQQQQADSNANMPFNASGQASNQNNNMNAALSMMGAQAGLGITMGGQPSFPGVVPRPAAAMNAPGVQGNLSYEMLQSFMQRNADMNQQN